MKTKRLQMAVAALALLLAGTSAFAGGPRKEIYMNIEKIDRTGGIPPVLKSPQTPGVWVEGSVLSFSGEHPAYVLSLTDDKGNLVYKVEIPESATEVTLPTEPAEGFSVEFIDGTWRIYGTIAPDGYRPMVVDGKMWKGYETDEQGNRYQYDYLLDGDTLINGQKYLRCFRNSERQDKFPRYMGALQEEKGKVYGIRADNSVPNLMYDFNLQVGDSVFCFLTGGFGDFAFINQIPHAFMMDNNGMDYTLSFKLKDIETVRSNDGSSLRRFVFDVQKVVFVSETKKNIKVMGVLYWSEGVGVENYYPFLPWESQLYSTNKYQLEECSVGQKPLWSRSVITTIEQISTSPTRISSATCYDLQGRRIQGEPQKGMYIRGGRKYVRK